MWRSFICLKSNRTRKTRARSSKPRGRICELIPGDLADPAFCDEVVERTVGAFGRLDILVSNAAQQSSKKARRT